MDCGGKCYNGPDKRYGRCSRCGRIDYEANEGDLCRAPALELEYVWIVLTKPPAGAPRCSRAHRVATFRNESNARAFAESRDAQVQRIRARARDASLIRD